MRNNRLKTTIIAWTILFFSLITVLLVILSKIRPTVVNYALSTLESQLLLTADNAVIKVLDDEKVSYDKLSVISRDNDNNITGIEIDVTDVNRLKNLISKNILNEISKSDIHRIGIPLGTLISETYFGGLGPKIYFNLVLSKGCRVNFTNKFFEAGINQTLHQIIIDITLTGNIITIGKSKSFKVNTTAIAAQTVIVGSVPSSFTEVIEDNESKTADRIFNYSK